MAFPGFQDGEVNNTPIPASFFSELLPEIDHLGELKITLYSFWQLGRKEGVFRYLRFADFTQNEQLMNSLGANQKEAEAQLKQSLDRAVQRGTLLEIPVHLDEVDFLYFLNSPKGRAAAQAIERGEWRPGGDDQMPVEILPQTANIYRLYEENIGPLTPLIADALREADENYPAEWIEEATRLAVENNARSWRYIEAILSRWQEKGKDERKDRRDTEKARRRYAEWEDAE
jgi:DNA replication protein